MKKMAFVFLAIAIMGLSYANAQDLKPTRDLALLRIKVENSANKSVAGTVISVRNESGETLVSKVTDEKGMIALLVPRGKTYVVKFISLAYEDKETVEKITVPDKQYFKFTLKLIYNPISASSFILHGVLFDHGKDTLKPESYPALENLLVYMKTKTSAEIVLSGHTDNVGDDDSNQKLSERRAKRVKKYLVSKGISAKRIVAVGYGEKVPIATNNTPEGRKKNRRTEVKILKE